jgi:hypothetical protein
MRLRALCAAAVLSLLVPQGCTLLPDDGSGTTVDLGECTGGPVAVTIPATVYCDITSIAATISGPDMTTLDVSIDRDSPSATLSIPSGPERQLVVRVFTAADPATPAFISNTFTFCVSDQQPVTVSVDAAKSNRPPLVGAIGISDVGELVSGKPVTLTVSAIDPDACDSVTSYAWTSDVGIMSGSGNTAVWVPRCPSFAGCEATVAVAVQDGRGGTTTVQATYTVGPLR